MLKIWSQNLRCHLFQTFMFIHHCTVCATMSPDNGRRVLLYKSGDDAVCIFMQNNNLCQQNKTQLVMKITFEIFQYVALNWIIWCCGFVRSGTTRPDWLSSFKTSLAWSRVWEPWFRKHGLMQPALDFLYDDYCGTNIFNTGKGGLDQAYE